MAIDSGAGPHFAWLNVNGQQFPLEHGSVDQHANRKASAFSGVVPFSYPGAEQTFAELVGGNAATITVSTRGTEAVLVTGEIDTTEFDYNQRTIRFTGRDKSAKLHDNKSSEKWLNKKPSEIASDLASRVGLVLDVMPSTVMAGKQLTQDYVYLTDNVGFGYAITKLAQFDGARWWADPAGMFHYQPLGASTGIYTLNYEPNADGPIKADFMNLAITHNLHAGKTIAVTVKSWHSHKKQVFQDTSNVAGKGGQLDYNYHVPGLLQDHVTKHARSQAAEKARHEFTIEATVVGDPSINVAMGLQLNGTGVWDQVYAIDHIAHEIGMSGHTTTITARSAKAGRSPS